MDIISKNKKARQIIIKGKKKPSLTTSLCFLGEGEGRRGQSGRW